MLWTTIFSCIFALLVLISTSAAGEEIDYRNEIFNKILANKTLNKLVLPRVSNSSIVVEMDLNGMRLNKVNTNERTVSYTVFFYVKWQDLRLTWDPKKFGGIQHINMPVENVWRPDISSVFADNNRFLSDEGIVSVVYNTGIVLTVPMIHSKFYCTADQSGKKERLICKEKFISWTYSEENINLTYGIKKENIKFDSVDDEWKVIQATAIREEEKHECCDDIYPQINVTIILERKKAKSCVLLPLVMMTSVLGFVSLKRPATKLKIITIFILIATLALIGANNSEQDIAYKNELQTSICLATLILFWSILTSCLLNSISNHIPRGSSPSNFLLSLNTFCCLLSKRSKAKSLEDGNNLTSINKWSVIEAIILLVDRSLAILVFVFVFIKLFV